jgi:hypothetical protein
MANAVLLASLVIEDSDPSVYGCNFMGSARLRANEAFPRTLPR